MPFIEFPQQGMVFACYAVNWFYQDLRF